jgi:mono/diheme cytochrome c family protein
MAKTIFMRRVRRDAMHRVSTGNLALVLLCALALTFAGAACAAKPGAPLPAATPAPQTAAATPPGVPALFAMHCSKCHGANGEGKDKTPSLKGVSTREEEPLKLEDIIGIINDPPRYGVSDKMPSFKDKMSAAEIKEVATWVAAFK